MLTVNRQGVPESKSIDGLDEALQMFSRKNGKERTEWAEHNHEGKIELIGEKLGAQVQTALSFLFYHCYKYSSEVAHGTLFGAAFVYGLAGLDVPPEPEEMTAKIGDDPTMLMLAVHTAVAGVIAAYCGKSEGSDLLKQSSALYDDLIKLLKQGMEPSAESEGTWLSRLQIAS